MKKILTLCLVVALAFSFCACNVTTTKTTTTTTTDADGNTHTESTTVTNENGDVTTTKRDYLTLYEAANDGEYHEFPITLINASEDYSLTGFYITKAGEESYSGEDLFQGEIIKPGNSATGLVLTLNKINGNPIVCDFGITVKGEDTPIWFRDVDISNDNSEAFELKVSEKNGEWTIEHK